MKTTFAEFHRLPAGAPTECAPLSDVDDLASNNEGKKAPVVRSTQSGDDLYPTAADHVRADAAALALVDLVNTRKATTRLVNALNRAHHRRTLPFLTMGDYVAAGESAKDAMLTVRGVGRKVADELDDLVLSTLADSTNGSDRPDFDAPPLAAEHTSVPTAQFFETRLAELLDKVPFPSVLYGFPLPLRLERLLKELHAAERLPVRTLRGYLRRKEEVHALLFKQRNCGRKSLVALDDVCASIFHSVLVHCGMSREAAKEAVRRLLLKDRHALPTPAGTEFVKTLSGFSCTDTADEAIDLDALSPVEFLSTALANGPTERERDILARRLGLDGSRGRTLEEIASEYGLTRERIRQLEKNALRKCRLSANRVQFKRYLETKENEIWRLLAGDRPFLPRGRVKAETQLPGLVRLSLEVVFGGAEGWLNRHGDPDTTDNLDGSWDHEFASGGDDLPSYTIEVGMPKVPAFFVHAGVKLNSIALEFTRSGPAAATINAIAQGETRFGTSQGGTPTSLTFSRISQFQGSIKRAGSPVGNLTGGSFTYSNNLEKIETIRDDGLIEGADPTIAALTGRIDVRFADTTLIDLAAGDTPVDLEFAYTLSAQAKLVLTAHEVYLPKPKLAVEGPGGVQASFDFRGAKNDGAGRMLTVTLTNDLDGTVYA